MTVSDVAPGDYTLARLREWLASRLARGVKCPVCGQHAQEYPRRLTGPMIGTIGRMLAKERELTGMPEPGKHPWIHLAEIEQPSRDVATAAYWNLIQQHPHKRGYWRVTDFGREFLEGARVVAEKVHVYNGEIRGFSGVMIDVYSVEPGFDLDELLGGDG